MKTGDTFSRAGARAGMLLCEHDQHTCMHASSVMHAGSRRGVALQCDVARHVSLSTSQALRLHVIS